MSGGGAFRTSLAAHGLATAAHLNVVWALTLTVHQRTDSGVWMSAAGLLAYLPFAGCSGVAGAWVDRRSRSTALAWSAALRALLALLAAVVVVLDVPVSVLLVVLAVGGVLATPSYPAMVALTVQTVPSGRRDRANALVSSVENGAWIGGPGICGLAWAAGCPVWVLLGAAAVCFAVAAVAAGRCRVAARPSGVLESGGPVLRGLAGPLTQAVVLNALVGFTGVALVVASTGWAGAATWAGLLTAAVAAGALVLPVVLVRAGWHAGPGVATGAAAVGLGAVAFVPAGPLALVAAGLVGGALVAGEVAVIGRLQADVCEHRMAELFGRYDQWNVSAVALGAGVAGPLSAWVGSVAALVGAGVVGLVVVVSAGRRAPVRIPAMAGETTVTAPQWTTV